MSATAPRRRRARPLLAGGPHDSAQRVRRCPPRRSCPSTTPCWAAPPRSTATRPRWSTASTARRSATPQLDAFTRRIAAALADAGLRKGDVLALHSPNSLLFPAVFYGATRAGAAVSTVHPLATAEEFARQLRDSGARWIVTVSPLLEVGAAGGRAGRAGCEEIFVCDHAERASQRCCDMLAEHRARAGGHDRPGRGPGRAAVLLGHDVHAQGRDAHPPQHRHQPRPAPPADPERPGDKLLAVLPFFHIYGLTALMNAPLRNGATVVVLPRFELDQFLAAIEKHQVNALYVAPPIVLALAKHPDVDEVRPVVAASSCSARRPRWTPNWPRPARAGWACRRVHAGVRDDRTLARHPCGAPDADPLRPERSASCCRARRCASSAWTTRTRDVARGRGGEIAHPGPAGDEGLPGAYARDTTP